MNTIKCSVTAKSGKTYDFTLNVLTDKFGNQTVEVVVARPAIDLGDLTEVMQGLADNIKMLGLS
jgi:hypothetical protein